MASESVTTSHEDPATYGARPVKGNYTEDATLHLWGAKALAKVVANPEAFVQWNSDIQEALRWLLSREIDRANSALRAEKGY